MKVLYLNPKPIVCSRFPDFDSVEMTTINFTDMQNFLMTPRNVEKQAVWEWYFLTTKGLIEYVSLIMKERGAHWTEQKQWGGCNKEGRIILIPFRYLQCSLSPHLSSEWLIEKLGTTFLPSAYFGRSGAECDFTTYPIIGCWVERCPVFFNPMLQAASLLWMIAL